MRRYYLGVLFLIVCAVLLRCGKEIAGNPYRNITDKTATYVGMDECRTCHASVYETYIKTGMGQSWGPATRAKSAADFGDKHPPVYDNKLDLYYKAFWKNDELYIKEYRLYAGDTTHLREEKISYIIGSGQHTNSHIIDINGYLYQAPITFYTQKGRWDFAPGFEDGNDRFSRKIETECITCHNGYPKHIAGSLNKYANVKLGIDCERCHGPGSIHVTEKRAGNIVDTSQGPDYSIVNPARLLIEEQNNLCQRCHLQGIAVLNNGKNFFDFMPSQQLKNTMNVFMPSFSGSEKHMIMASHVERMKMSNCYVNSGKMSCITCHNPHITVKETPIAAFNAACKNCHTNADGCSENMIARKAKKDNCSACHMVKNESIDIPHVAVTDHYIRKKPTVENEEAIRNFIGLKSYNNEAPDKRTQARAFLEFFERYQPNPLLLDSALAYLSHADKRQPDNDMIRTYFLQKKYAELGRIAKALEVKDIDDAWTAYRLGESLVKNNQTAAGIPYLQRAVALMPLGLDFRIKLANAFIANGQFDLAQQAVVFILKENPKFDEAYKILAYLNLRKGNYASTIQQCLQALQLNPFNEQTYINLAVAYYQQKNYYAAKTTLLKAKRLYPANAQINAMLSDLNKSL